MGAEKPQSAEAFALERIAAAAREVQAASTALQTHFAGERHDEGRHTSALDNPTVDHSRQGANHQNERHGQLPWQAETLHQHRSHDTRHCNDGPAGEVYPAS